MPPSSGILKGGTRYLYYFIPSTTAGTLYYDLVFESLTGCLPLAWAIVKMGRKTGSINSGRYLSHLPQKGAGITGKGSFQKLVRFTTNPIYLKRTSKFAVKRHNIFSFNGT